MADPAAGGDAPILVPVDFSADAEGALAFAADLAVALKAPLVVLHVVHDPADAPGYYARALGDSPPQLRKLEDLAGTMMSEFLERFRTTHPDTELPHALQTQLVSGLPVARILEVIDRLAPRMVVLGSRGRTGLSHLLLGSKAEQVARLSPVPVLLVKLPPEPEAASPETPEPDAHTDS